MINFDTIFKKDLNLNCLFNESNCSHLDYRNIKIMFEISRCRDELISVGEPVNSSLSPIKANKVITRHCGANYTVYFISECKYSIDDDANEFDIMCITRSINQSSIKILFIDKTHMTDSSKMASKRVLTKVKLSDLEYFKGVYMLPVYSTKKSMLFLNRLL